MIAIRRNRVAAPAILGPESKNAISERARAQTFFANPRGQRPGTFTFRMYKDHTVKAALETLFSGKCAYCESRYTATQPVDVEHWRPKADVDLAEWETCTDFPGYYWLASDWENLLPSCIDCNRRREQTDVARGAVMSGKETAFPVRRDTQRARTAADLPKEQPLLLNPCNDDPALYLAPHRDDESVLVALPTLDMDRGAASIEVYGLNRAGLVLERRERLFTIRHHLYQLTELLKLAAKRLKPKRDVAEGPQRSVAEELQDYVLEELIKRELAVLAAMRRPSEPYNLMSRALIDGYLREVLGIAL